MKGPWPLASVPLREGRKGACVAEGGHEPSLSDGEWSALVGLWGEVATFPRGDAEGAARHLLRGLCELLDASAGYVTLLSRDKRPADRSYRPVFGWRPVYTLGMADDGRVLDDVAEKHLRRGEYADDPSAKATVTDAGRRRAYLRRELVDDETFPRTPLGKRLRALGAVDRLIGVQPIARDLETVVYLDRSRGGPFSTKERRVLFEGLRGLGPLLTCLTRGAGYVDCTEPLTPRERVVLRMLLTGRREADIALDLDMGRRSLHQRVVNIYRKFGVGSRPQLMALWLNAAPDAASLRGTRPFR